MAYSYWFGIACNTQGEHILFLNIGDYFHFKFWMG